jgi:hypothetical protein
MEKKLRGRPLKLDEDKLIGRRISMVQGRWDIVDRFCEINEVTLNELFCDVSETFSDMLHGEEEA